MNTRHTHLTLLLLFTVSGLSGQAFPGYQVDNYAGVPGLLLNPANAANNPVAFEVHLAAGAAGLANDYISLGKFGDYDFGEVDWDSGPERVPAQDNSLFAHGDVVGPSLLIGLGRHLGLGLVTRARALYGLRNVDGRLLEGFENGFEDMADFSTEFSGFGSEVHGWGEVSAVLGAVIVDRPELQVSAGVSLKHLRGLGGSFARSERFSAQYLAETDRLNTAGDLQYGSFGYGSDLEFETGELTDAPGSGFGFDVGISFEWRPGKGGGVPLRRPYRLKFAASVVDIGAVAYPLAERTRYAAEGSLPVDDFEGDDLGAVLDRYYDGATVVEDLEFRLPTSLYLHLDYRLAGKLYVSVLSASALSGEGPGSRIQNTLTVAPRLETKWLGLYAPVRIGGTEGTTVGAGIRLGFVTVGSGSILSHLLTDTNYAADVYAGVRIPFLRRHKPKKPDIVQDAD